MTTTRRMPSVSQVIASLFISAIIATMGSVTIDFNKKKTEVHEHIIATTEDASNGSGTVRVQRAIIGAGTAGCSVTVQRYSRANPDALYKEPPELITHSCLGSN